MVYGYRRDFCRLLQNGMIVSIQNRNIYYHGRCVLGSVPSKPVVRQKDGLIPVALYRRNVENEGRRHIVYNA